MRFCLWNMVAVAATAAEVHPAQQNHPMNRHPGKRRQLQDEMSSDSPLRKELKQKLLENYDRTMFPFEELWANSNGTMRRGLNVELGINFHRVFDVDVTTHVADMIVWLRQRWKDPRLAWDESQYNISKMWFWVGEGSGSGGEMSQIWTPDLQLWNLDSPISASLTDTYAFVSSDGTVFWSRPGHIKPVCKFRGLENFPFDTLDCTMEIGSWSHSGLYIRLTKLDGEGVSVGGSDTAGEAFAEYSLSHVSAEEHVYPPYPAAPEEDWPVIFYHIRFQRAWEPYARGYLTLQVILNVAAFCCLWLPPHIGERMSLSITSVLAAVAAELVIESQLPAASEQTWFSKFSIVSMLFTAVVLFESAAVIYFHYHTGDNLKPRWYQWIERKLIERIRGEIKVKFENDVTSARQDEAAPASNPGNKVAAYNGKAEIVGDPVDADTDEVVGETAHETAHDDSATTANDESSSDRAFEDALNLISSLRTSSNLGPRSSSRTRERIKTILGRDADDFKNVMEMENNLRWQRVAHDIDDWARVLLPAAFIIFLASTFSNARV